MKKSNTLAVVLLSLLVVLISSSCVVQQGLSLTESQSGWATTDLYVFDFFLTVLQDFEPFVPEDEGQSIMDASVEDFIEQLHTTSSASNISSMKIGNNSYFIDFTFSSLQDLLFDLNKRERQTIVTITTKGRLTTLDFFLDLENYPQLTQIVPFLADPNFETFGPLYNEGLSEEEYLDMISYILGEEGPPAIAESVISLRFTTPKVIVRQEGCVKESSNSVRVDVPLIDFLLLNKPITFSITW